MGAAGAAMVLILFLGLGVVAVGALVYYGVQQAKARRAALLAWAAGRGWTYVGDAPHLVSRWRGKPFGTGHSRRATSAVTGSFAGRPAIMFDYQYTTGSGKNRTTHRYHVTVLSLPAQLPYLQLTPEHFGTAVARVFGGQDIELESEQFNQRWRVQAVAPRFAFDVLHPRLMERLLYPDALVSMRIEGSDLVSWSVGQQDLQRADARLALLNDVVASVPDFVWRQVGYDPHRSAPGTPGPSGTGQP